MSNIKRNFTPDAEFNRDSAEWMELTAKMAADKAREIELRNRLISKVYKNGVVPVGTNNVLLPEGWVLKVNGKVNYRVEEDAVEATKGLIAEKVAAGEITEFSFDDIVKYKPDLSLSGWNGLTEEQKHLIRNCVTERPGQASIEITKPKRAIR
ncbi:MAG: hypothetical protein M0P09_01390 [Acholeplasmataceae bacterium]|nr:hypothetical protein [Acholeplasmataceae bacterium]